MTDKIPLIPLLGLGTLNMRNTLITLAEIHYELGAIDYTEFNERFGVALWLVDELPDDVIDPRDDSENEVINNEDEPEGTNELTDPVVARLIENNGQISKNKEKWLEFLCLGRWVFTKADPDPYPSVPHGHYNNQNNKWPKLNPYTGRVFSDKHQEDKSKRLSKMELKQIWSDERFKSFCREMIVWYREQFPYYSFPVRRPFRMPIY